MSHWEKLDVKHQELCVSDPDYGSPTWEAIRELEENQEKLKSEIERIDSYFEFCIKNIEDSLRDLHPMSCEIENNESNIGDLEERIEIISHVLRELRDNLHSLQRDGHPHCAGCATNHDKDSVGKVPQGEESE